MGIQIEKSFSVNAPAEKVWDFLTDPHQVAKCLPGAEIVGQEDDSTFLGKMKMKVGPVSASYDGKIVFEKVDPEAREVVIRVTSKAARGMGGADMVMSSKLEELVDGQTDVTTTSDLTVTGMLAQFGRGMIDSVGDRMFDQFVNKVKAELEA